MQCKICAAGSRPLFQKLVLKKYYVDYYRCPDCGFIQTEKPYWLQEAYSSAISDLDLGPVNRAIRGSHVVEGVILANFDPNARFIDWGGGYGVFTRLMRDIGYDFYWSDRYCQNLFAKQFVADSASSYELLTAFEVFEHLVDPLVEIEAMLRRSRNLLFTTMIPPPETAQLENWWYLTLEHGQHVALYSVEALKVVASKFDLYLVSNGADTHLLSSTPFSERMFRTIARDGRAAGILRRLKRRRLKSQSLLMKDFRAVTGWNV